MPAKVNPSIADRLQAALCSDPKRTSLLAGLFVVMLVLWGRMLLKGPASATASLIRRSVAAMTTPANLSQRSASSTPVLDWLAQPKGAVARNLFAVHLDYYARASQRKTSANGQNDMNPNGPDESDQTHERQILLDNLQSAAGKLKLQTTMMGPVPHAMVNGEVVREGQTVSGFEVLKIEPRKITVRQEGVVLDIPMN